MAARTVCLTFEYAELGLAGQGECAGGACGALLAPAEVLVGRSESDERLRLGVAVAGVPGQV